MSKPNQQEKSSFGPVPKVKDFKTLTVPESGLTGAVLYSGPLLLRKINVRNLSASATAEVMLFDAAAVPSASAAYQYAPVKLGPGQSFGRTDILSLDLGLVVVSSSATATAVAAGPALAIDFEYDV